MQPVVMTSNSSDEFEVSNNPCQIAMKRVLIVCQNCSERQHLLNSPFLKGRYELIFHGDCAEEAPGEFDILSFIDATVEKFQSISLDGVASSSDYPGCLVAAAVAKQLSLPGVDPEKLLLCSHKYYSRLAQFTSVPEATANFALIDPVNPQPPPNMKFPLFVKPVKSWFSVLARRIDSADELVKFVSSTETRNFLENFTPPFNQYLKRYSKFDLDARYMLAEELISGNQVTVEGFINHGNVEIIGITDSIMHPGTISFARFDYPSSLPLAIQNRMTEVVRRVIHEIGLNNSLFNVELFYDSSRDYVKIIEINPRMVGQFADLMEKVNGINTFEIMLSLVTGQIPFVTGGKPMYPFATSFPLRAFHDKRPVHLPQCEQLIVANRTFPRIRLNLYYSEGQKLSDAGIDQNDTESYCYGFLNLGRVDHASLLKNFSRAYDMLGFVLEDVD
jgi:hypothetical protein